MFCLFISIGITPLCDNENQDMHITAYIGDSAFLPCSCGGLSRGPQKFRWYKTSDPWKTEEVDNEYRRRRQIQLFGDVSTGNFSLFIPHLTEEDEGEYSCSYYISDMVSPRSNVKGIPQAYYYVPDIALVRITTTNLCTALYLQQPHV